MDRSVGDEFGRHKRKALRRTADMDETQPTLPDAHLAFCYSARG